MIQCPGGKWSFRMMSLVRNRQLFVEPTTRLAQFFATKSFETSRQKIGTPVVAEWIEHSFGVHKIDDLNPIAL